MPLADNSTLKSGNSVLPSAAPVHAEVDTSKYEWIEVPETDIFGDEHTGVSVNFINYGPGRHFVEPELAKTLRILLANRMRGDMRVLQPNQDKKMLEVMERNGTIINRGK